MTALEGLEEFPPLPLEGAAAEDAGLFGAALTGGTFDPACIVNIAGLGDVATSTGGGTPTGQVVLDDVEVRWGRDELLDQPGVGTGTCSLFDATREWATTNDLIGLVVTLRYGGDDATDTYQSGVFFRGRITDVNRSLRTVAGVTGELVQLSMSSLLGDLANRLPTVSWPEETVEARRVRVAASSTGAINSVTVRPYWLVPNIRPFTVDDQQSVYEHLLSLYDSSGADRMSYLPDAKGVTYVVRRDYPTTRGTVRLWWDQGSGARQGQGVYARTIALGPAGAAGLNPALYLDAAAIEYDPDDGVSKDVTSRVSTVQVAHPTAADPSKSPNYPTRVTELTVTGADEATEGVRTARLTSSLTNNSYVDVAVSDLEALVRNEAQEWALAGTLVYRTRPAGGFESVAQAELLLAGGEVNTLIVLQRSFLPRLGIRPVFGVMGGSIAYRRRGWQVELIPAPITTTADQHPIHWDEFDADPYEVQWWDSDHASGMHESLTYEDCGYISCGLGVSSVPADTGWDFQP
jgi:hypothetical protein